MLAHGPPRLMLTTVLLPGLEICLALINDKAAIILLVFPKPLSANALRPKILLQFATPTVFPPTVPKKSLLLIIVIINFINLNYDHLHSEFHVHRHQYCL